MRTTLTLDGSVGAFVERFAAKQSLTISNAVRLLLLKHQDYEAYERDQSNTARSEARAKQFAAAAKAKPKKHDPYAAPDDMPEDMRRFWPPRGHPKWSLVGWKTVIRERDGAYTMRNAANTMFCVLLPSGRLFINGLCPHGEREEYYCSRCEAELTGMAEPPMVDANGQPVEDSPWPTPAPGETDC